MLRVTYQHYCDVCGNEMQQEQTDVPTSGVIPHPAMQVVMNNAALCTTCASLAVPAMNEALKDRLKRAEA